MGYVQAKDGTQLYTKSWGSGAPVLLVHGWPLSADTWDPIANSIAKAGYQAVLYDRRGFGRSDQPYTGYDYDTLAGDLSSVVEHLGLSGIHLVGFSMGGGEVVRYASKHLFNVKSISLIGSVVPGMVKSESNPDGVPAEVFKEIQSGILDNRPEFFKNFFPDFYGNKLLSKPVPQSVLDWTQGLAMQAGLKGTLDCVDSFGHTDFRSDLPGISVPALVIHGQDDQIVPIATTSRVAAKLLPNSRLHEIPGGHHGVLVTHEAEITKELLAHFKNAS